MGNMIVFETTVSKAEITRSAASLRMYQEETVSFVSVLFWREETQT